MGMPILLEELARCTFNETEQFERVLLMQMNDLRKTGAVVIITTRITGVLTDLIGRMKRMGTALPHRFCRNSIRRTRLKQDVDHKLYPRWSSGVPDPRNTGFGKYRVG